MKAIIVLFIFTYASSALAFKSAPEPESQSFTYGAFHFSPGYAYTSLLNQDGTKAVYSGPAVNGEFDLIFSIKDLGLGVGPFVHYFYSQQNNLSNNNGRQEDLERSDFMYGLKALLNPFYAGFAFGTNTSRLNLGGSSNTSRKLESRVLGFTGGLRVLGLGDGWSLGLSAWYKSSFYDRSRNPDLTGGTAMESLDLFITITCSPLFQIL